MYRTLYVRPSHKTTPDIQDERTPVKLAEEWGEVIGGENLRPAKSRCSPPKTPLFFEQQKSFRAGLPAKPIKTKMVLKSFEPKTIFNACLRQAKGALNPSGFIKKYL